MRGQNNKIAWLCVIWLSACVEHTKLMDEAALGNSFRFPPIINTKYLSPHPSRLLEPISVGKKCNGVIFRVPPVDDRNRNDRLYYLWFLDNKLAGPRSIIEPHARNSAVITFKIDQQFLLSHYESKIPDDFYRHSHIIDFYVSDTDYIIPETRLLDEAKESHEDYAYWIVSFSNDPC